MVLSVPNTRWPDARTKLASLSITHDPTTATAPALHSGGPGAFFVILFRALRRQVLRAVRTLSPLSSECCHLQSWTSLANFACRGIGLQHRMRAADPVEANGLRGLIRLVMSAVASCVQAEIARFKREHPGTEQRRRALDPKRHVASRRATVSDRGLSLDPREFRHWERRSRAPREAPAQRRKPRWSGIRAARGGTGEAETLQASFRQCRAWRRSPSGRNTTATSICSPRRCKRSRPTVIFDRDDRHGLRIGAHGSRQETETGSARAAKRRSGARPQDSLRTSTTSPCRIHPLRYVTETVRMTA